MPAKEISLKDAAEAVAARANGSARRLSEIADVIETVSRNIDGPSSGPVLAIVKLQVTRLRDEARALNGG